MSHLLVPEAAERHSALTIAFDCSVTAGYTAHEPPTPRRNSETPAGSLDSCEAHGPGAAKLVSIPSGPAPESIGDESRACCDPKTSTARPQPEYPAPAAKHGANVE